MHPSTCCSLWCTRFSFCMAHIFSSFKSLLRVTFSVILPSPSHLNCCIAPFHLTPPYPSTAHHLILLFSPHST